MSNSNGGLSLVEAATGVMIAAPAAANIIMYVTGAVPPADLAGPTIMAVIATIFIGLSTFIITRPLRGANREKAVRSFSTARHLLSTGLVAVVMTTGSIVAGSGGLTITEIATVLAAGVTAAALGYAVTTVRPRNAAWN